MEREKWRVKSGKQAGEGGEGIFDRSGFCGSKADRKGWKGFRLRGKVEGREFDPGWKLEVGMKRIGREKAKRTIPFH